MGRAQAILNMPVESVLGAVQDYGSYADFFPHFTTSRILAKRGANAVVYLEADIIKRTYKVWAQVRFREQPRKADTHVIEGTMVQGNLNRLESRWEITPLGKDRTLVTFQIFFDPKLPIPDSIVSDQNSNAARKTIKSLRDKRLFAAK